MKNGAVIGYPIAHSLSPRIFSFLAKELKISDLSYEALEVKPQELSSFLKSAKAKFLGLNVTIPHKEEVIKDLDGLTAQANGVGAVNCISFKPSTGDLIQSTGHNTDVLGFTHSLLECDVSLKGQHAIILGAGGASRAVAYALASLEYQGIQILSKTASKAASLVREFEILFPNTEFKVSKTVSDLDLSSSLIVNATPLGMDGYYDDGEKFFREVFERNFVGAVAYDLIYRPKSTPFLKKAREYGVSTTIGGLDMLIYQALSSWEIFFDVKLDRVVLKERLKVYLDTFLEPASLKFPNRIYIAGFMGVGKSTIAKLVAHRLERSYIDIDQKIEEKLKKTVGEIFQEQGEDFFRQLERDTIQEFSEKDNLVIALGGGALTMNQNSKLIRDSGPVVFLSASVDTLASRLKNSIVFRPLLKHDKTSSLTQHIEKLLKPRLESYRQAQFEIDTENKTDDAVASELISLFQTEAK